MYRPKWPSKYSLPSMLEKQKPVKCDLMEIILPNFAVLSYINSLVNSSCNKDSDLYRFPV